MVSVQVAIMRAATGVIEMQDDAQAVQPGGKAPDKETREVPPGQPGKG